MPSIRTHLKTCMINSSRWLWTTTIRSGHVDGAERWLSLPRFNRGQIIPSPTLTRLSYSCNNRCPTFRSITLQQPYSFFIIRYADAAIATSIMTAIFFLTIMSQLGSTIRHAPLAFTPGIVHHLFSTLSLATTFVSIPKHLIYVTLEDIAIVLRHLHAFYGCVWSRIRNTLALLLLTNSIYRYLHSTLA